MDDYVTRLSSSLQFSFSTNNVEIVTVGDNSEKKKAVIKTSHEECYGTK
jgi:hypothetical protein